MEKIAELAQRPAPGEGGKGGDARWKGLSAKGTKDLHAEFDDALKNADELVLTNGAIRRPKQVVKQGLSEYFLFTIEGREDIKDKEPKRLVSMKVADVPLECIYKLTDRDGGKHFTKYYRFKNKKLLDDDGKEKDLPGMENLGLSAKETTVRTLPVVFVLLFPFFALPSAGGLKKRMP